jgi:hypothetical protein
MVTSRRWRPVVEPLDERTLPSTMPGMGMTVPPLIRVSHHSAHHLTLTGQVSGTWVRVFSNPDVGATQALTGSGTVKPLGNVQANGTLHLTGFVAQGEATGTLTLTTGRGRVTLALVGPPQPGFSGPPSSFHYTITGGTGRFAHATGSGTAGFTETSGMLPNCPPNALCLPLALFTLTFPAPAA